MSKPVKKPWQEIAKEAQNYRDSTMAEIQPPLPDVSKDLPINVTGIPRDILSRQELEITESTPEDLVAALAIGKLSSETVVRAFLRRAGLAQKLTNCVTELLPKRAIERARYLDDYLKIHGKPVGPLHGLPISAKEIVGTKGLSLSMGFVGHWEDIAENDALILQLLWNAGCNFHARTSEPQCLMHLESGNNLYGDTLNPYNRNLTSGGSSGGEGALIGLLGSCLGIGTDIGGSIRSPAANCGVWGFKPTSKRLPLAGIRAPMLGQEQIVAVVGPLSTSFEGLDMFMRALIDQRPWTTDPSLVPLPWKHSDGLLANANSNRKVKVAVMWNDGIVQPHPPVTRALKELVGKLETVPEIEVVEWKPWKHDQAWKIISSMYFCDGGKQEHAAMALSGEPLLPLSKFILDEQGNSELSITQVWELTQQREAYRAAYAKIWNETGIEENPVDLILCPAGPGAAPPLGHARYWGYTSLWNLLDYPAMTFPVTSVNQQKDLAVEDFGAVSDQDQWNHDLYSPERYTDAPVSLQLVARRYEDEKIFAAVDFIKKAIGGLPFSR